MITQLIMLTPDLTSLIISLRTSASLNYASVSSFRELEPGLSPLNSPVSLETWKQLTELTLYH